ncbi:MAG: hypothetical protein Q8O30_06470 [Candidatus Omnitrophota bacterium]|nr:hypothetical protein [Candidatus Omnitrophota bacterium]
MADFLLRVSIPGQANTPSAIALLESVLQKNFPGCSVEVQDDATNSDIQASDDEARKEDKSLETMRDQKRVQQYNEQIGRMIDKIPDGELPSHYQYASPDVRYFKKYELAVEELSRRGEQI